MNILISAGPTREAIDPVRYISNRSSGKMGYALARAAMSAWHHVTLVSGPVALPKLRGLARQIDVTTAQEMYDAMCAELPKADIIIMAAAVADYRPKTVLTEKHKKTPDETWTLELVKNPDILADLSARKTPSQILMGFAAETENLEAHALDKLRRKKLDWIFANDVSSDKTGFDSDLNAGILFSDFGIRLPFSAMEKDALAEAIFQAVIDHPNPDRFHE